MSGEASLLLDRMAEAAYYSQHVSGDMYVCGAPRWSALAPEVHTYYRKTVQDALRVLYSELPNPCSPESAVVSDLLRAVP